MLYTALITPFKEDQTLDVEGLIQLIERQVPHADGILVLGTTGEAPTLTPEEKQTIIRITRQAWPKKSLIVGTGAYSTLATIKSSQEAEKLGADGVLVVTPYYNKPTQEGLYLHFKTVAESIEIPLFLYNIFSRTGISLTIETICRLASIKNISGLKETSSDLFFLSCLREAIQKINPDFSLFSGDDQYNFPYLSLGVQGLFSVFSNLYPKELKELITLTEQDRFSEARAIHYRFLALFEALAIETNPIPIKAALEFCGLPCGKPRLPLSPLSLKHSLNLKELLDNYGTEKQS